MSGCGEQGFAGRLLDDLSSLHHTHALRDAAHQIEVVTDQQQRHAQALLQGFEQHEDLALHGDVQCCRWLVGDQQLRFAGQRHGDHHPLPLPPRELMRISLQPLLRLLNADHSEQFQNALLRLFTAKAAVQQQSLADLFFDGV